MNIHIHRHKTNKYCLQYSDNLFISLVNTNNHFFQLYFEHANNNINLYFQRQRLTDGIFILAAKG